jgi:LPXTG-motif cell wall-anchored protein
MKKTFLKKALAFASAALLALPLMLNTNIVNAADGDPDTGATPTEQHVILTKYGFDKEEAATDRATDKTWDGNGAKTLAGVEFKIYDVTADYWTAPKDYKGAYKESELVDTQVTGTDGTFGKDLPTVSKDADGKSRAAVYLFHETNPRAGYNTSADFWLTLPAAADSDGNVYVYPKNVQATTYNRTFIKKDAATGEVLPGAKFVIKQGDKFVKLTDKDGADVTAGDGFIDVLSNNYRISLVDTEATATTFTSDKDGKFGLNGFADDQTSYTAVETDAPDGYEKAADTDFKADNSTSDINDKPTGILPHTGGAGILLFVALGAVLIVLGGVAYAKRRARF